MFQQAGRYGCAAEAYRSAAALDPASATLEYSLGSNLYAAQEMEGAVTALKKAIALNPSMMQAHLTLGVVDHDRGMTKDALREWQEALRLDPSSVTAIDWIAKARMEAGQYATAAELLRDAPEDEELLLDLIVADSKAGMFDEAIGKGQAAIQQHPEWKRIYRALATVLVQRNRYEEAAETLRTGLALQPGDLPTRLLYLRVLILKGDMQAAAKPGAELLKERPHDYEVLYLNGLLERQQGEYERALQHLEAAVAIRSNTYDVHYNLGFVLARLQKAQAAREHLQKAIDLDPSAAEAHFQSAGVLKTLGETEAAQKELAEYRTTMQARAKHDQAIAQSTEAADKLKAGDTASAISLYRGVAAESPDDPLAYYRLAMALDRADQLQEETEILRKAVELKPDFVAAQIQLGYIAAHAGNTEAAENYFRKSLESESGSAEAESNLGSLLAGQGREAEAEQHLRAAIADNPRFTDAWINLAATLAAASRFDEARDAANNALHIDAKNEDAARLLQSLPAAGGATP